jgi:hypothetical protein
MLVTQIDKSIELNDKSIELENAIAEAYPIPQYHCGHHQTPGNQINGDFILNIDSVLHGPMHVIFCSKQP